MKVSFFFFSPFQSLKKLTKEHLAQLWLLVPKMKYSFGVEQSENQPPSIPLPQIVLSEPELHW